MRRVTLVLIIILGGLIVYKLFYRTSAEKEAKRLAKELEHKVDSLNLLADSYEKMQYKYFQLYSELNQTRSKMADLKVQLSELSELQTTDIRSIKARLQSVVTDFDSLENKFRNSAGSTNLDSLRF